MDWGGGYISWEYPSKLMFFVPTLLQSVTCELLQSNSLECTFIGVNMCFIDKYFIFLGQVSQTYSGNNLKTLLLSFKS